MAHIGLDAADQQRGVTCAACCAAVPVVDGSQLLTVAGHRSGAVCLDVADLVGLDTRRAAHLSTVSYSLLLFSIHRSYFAA